MWKSLTPCTYFDLSGSSVRRAKSYKLDNSQPKGFRQVCRVQEVEACDEVCPEALNQELFSRVEQHMPMITERGLWAGLDLAFTSRGFA